MNKLKVPLYWYLWCNQKSDILSPLDSSVMKRKHVNICPVSDFSSLLLCIYVIGTCLGKHMHHHRYPSINGSIRDRVEEM